MAAKALVRAQGIYVDAGIGLQGANRWLVDVIDLPCVQTAVSHISNRKQRVQREFTLHCDVPVPCLWRFQMLIQRGDGERWGPGCEHWAMAAVVIHAQIASTRDAVQIWLTRLTRIPLSC